MLTWSLPIAWNIIPDLWLMDSWLIIDGLHTGLVRKILSLPNIHDIFPLSFLFAYDQTPDGTVPHLRISREHGRITSPATSPVSPTSLAPAICWWLLGRENKARGILTRHWTVLSWYAMLCHDLPKRRICVELVFSVEAKDSLCRSCVGLLVRTYVGSLFFCSISNDANVDMTSA